MTFDAFCEEKQLSETNKASFRTYLEGEKVELDGELDNDSLEDRLADFEDTTLVDDEDLVEEVEDSNEDLEDEADDLDDDD